MLSFQEHSPDGYLVFKAMEHWAGQFKTGDIIKYKVTGDCILSTRLDEGPGTQFIPGEEIMKKSIPVKPDDQLSKLFTLTKAKESNGLGAHLEQCESWTVNSGTVYYKGGYVCVGDEDDDNVVKYKIDENQLYLLPEGYHAEEAEQICSGVPDMVALKKINDKIRGNDYGVLYAVFYYYLKQLKMFEKLNSEPLELLFKLIVNWNFNINTAIENDPELINKYFHGAAIKNTTNSFFEAVHGRVDEKGRQLTYGQKYIHSNKIENILTGADKTDKSELKKNNTDTSKPTYTKIVKTKNFKGGYDWKGIFKEMHSESNDRLAIVEWRWDKVREHLRLFIGEGKDRDGNDKNNYSNSIYSCKQKLKLIPKQSAILSELTEEKDELNDELNSLDISDPRFSKIEAEIEAIQKNINNIKKQVHNESELLDKWKEFLKNAKEEFEGLTNKELKADLESWLTDGKYGILLKPYVTVTNTSVKLKITISQPIDDDRIERMNELQAEIKALRDEQAELDDTKPDEAKEIERLEKEINSLELEYRKTKYDSHAKTVLSHGDNWINAIIMGRKM